MKGWQFYFTAVILSFSLGMVFYFWSNEKQIPEEKVIFTLKCFYTEYIISSVKTPLKDLQQEQKKILQKYCTQDLLDSLDSLLSQGKLDYDPFVQAQDFFIEWIETMSIKKYLEGENNYSIFLWNEYSKNYRIIKVSVIEENGAYKINSINDIVNKN